ncbi:MAG TPA: carbon-nitrogen hydrolase family protein [Candidatus Brocadiia bacterium]|nr:carbon-nitrogen hydrolase family protein [Candidatus Brocadiia bacterium]
MSHNQWTRLAATAVSVEDYGRAPGPMTKDVDLGAVRRYSRRRVERLGEYFVRAWRAGADFVCGYEAITGAAHYGSLPETRAAFDALVETVPGPTTELFGKLARRHGGYCAICLEEKDGDRVYNTAVLIDRKGRIAGKYRKVHLPPQERMYATPGNAFPVFETDFGRVGFSICYDIMFPEASRAVALNGADLLVHMGNTTYTRKEESLSARAADNMLWLLACNITGMISMIVDLAGTVVARATPHTADVAMADVDLRCEREMPRDNLFSGVKSLRGRMLQERVPSAYRVIASARPPLLERYKNDRIPRTAGERRRVVEANLEAIRKLYG